MNKGAKRVNAQIHRENQKSSEFFKGMGYESQTHLFMVGKPLEKK